MPMRALPLLAVLAVLATLPAAGDAPRSLPARQGDPVAPRQLSVPPGQPIPAERGIWFVDPRTGAAEGWEFTEEAPFLVYEASPGGEFVAYGIPPGWTSAASPFWRLLDTGSGAVRELPEQPIVFSPDGARYATPVEDGIAIVQSATGSLLWRFPVAGLRAPVPFSFFRGAWSPDGATVIVASFDQPALPASALWRVLRLDLRTGQATELDGRPFPLTQWSPDGRAYLLSTDDGLDLRRAEDDGLIWSLGVQDVATEPLPTDRGKATVRMEDPRISPDGERLAFFVRAFPDIGRAPPAAPLFRAYVLDAATRAVRFWIEGASRCAPQVWSADGRWLLVLGRQGDLFGSYLVAADGSEISYLSEHVQGLSPTDPTIGATHAYPDPGALRIVGLPGGETLRTIDFTGPVMWHFEDQQWLDDGRLVVVAPVAGRDGCLLGPGDDRELEVRFP
jgi:hypothetical protein